jgi:hypothetical protein
MSAEQLKPTEIRLWLPKGMSEIGQRLFSPTTEIARRARSLGPGSERMLTRG